MRTILLCASLCSTWSSAVETFPIQAANGMAIVSPVDKASTEVREGSKIVKIPVGMVYVRGGSWYSTGRSGMSLCTGEGRNRHGAYHSVGFRIAMALPALEHDKKTVR